MQEPSHPGHAWINATGITGTPVCNPDGEKLGKIEDLVLTRAEGRAAYAILSFGGFLGMGERHYPLPWSMLSYDRERGAYIVSLTREDLDNAPSYGIDEPPNWSDPAWGTRVSDHYSQPPVMDPVEGEILR